eukprot:364921-Chlamydomonas_euryale.AAC.6
MVEGEGDDACMCVSARWLTHLEERALGADGQPFKPRAAAPAAAAAAEGQDAAANGRAANGPPAENGGRARSSDGQTQLRGEDGGPRGGGGNGSGSDSGHSPEPPAAPTAVGGAGGSGERLGLVLDWVYGSIVCTAEKAHDAAKRGLGTYIPTACDAHRLLLLALEEHFLLDTRGRQARAHMSELVKARVAVQRVWQEHSGGAAPVPSPTPKQRQLAGGGGGENEANWGPDLPTPLMLEMLRRESLMARAKVHLLAFEQVSNARARSTHVWGRLRGRLVSCFSGWE